MTRGTFCELEEGPLSKEQIGQHAKAAGVTGERTAIM